MYSGKSNHASLRRLPALGVHKAQQGERIRKTSRYKKSLRKMLRRGKDIKKISAVVRILTMGETLPPQYRDHALSGDLEGLRDCHIENDWVLFYFYTTSDDLILTLSDTSTHADLF